MIEKAYDPKKYEEDIYKKWESSGFFAPKAHQPRAGNPNSDKTFSIVLPPPNVTGSLHTGHAMMLAIQDIMIRHARMAGKSTLWLPGTDHAGIATQSKVEGILYKEEKKTKHDLGRERFLERVEDYAKKSHATITGQVKRMGASLDWSREAYTLDKDKERAVNTAFTTMYEDGLIYRGNRIVNWDPKLQTNVSDDEVDYVEETVPFYYLRYGPFTIATTRPETKFGDKYVVMHPDDKRYSEYSHGQKIDLEWINGPIQATIIKDPVIDMKLGSGAMTITPWHDATDFELAEKHNLDREQVIDLDGKLLPVAGEFAGMHIKKARTLIVEKLDKKGLVEKIDQNYTHNIATNSRGGGIIEPQIREQWFIDVNKKFKLKESLSGEGIEGIEPGQETTLKKMMQTVLRSGQIKIVPERFTKTYFNWIDNLRDWNISRQIWFGHRVPVWYRPKADQPEAGKEIHVGAEAPLGEGWEQDPDTLDTWFSSGLWTFSTLGWPDKTDDLKTFHPTDVLETGYDILFFWVARMILMSGYLLGDVPFKTVYLHGLVRDEKGQKMSKSLENIVDPIEVIDKFGADALRMAFIVGNTPGGDMNLGEEKVKAYKHFANKVWNASRFILMNLEGFDPNKAVAVESAELDALTKEVMGDIESFRFHLGAEKLYHYFWHTLADVIIEEEKDKVKNGSDQEKLAAQSRLYQELKTLLLLLHPFMPFVTEAIWAHLPKKDKDPEFIMMAAWPGSRNSTTS